MPFVSAKRPLIQLGLLKAEAEVHGLDVTTFSLNLDFAALIGQEQYEELCQHRGTLLGDWLFSLAAFGDEAPDPTGDFLQTISVAQTTRTNGGAVQKDRLRELREDVVPTYLTQLLAAEHWSSFDVIGFTSTFQQNVASFAFAKLLKQRSPSLITLFGGSNFESEMGHELVARMACIDYAITGEGDDSFPAFLQALIRGDDPASTPGVLCRRNGWVVETPPIPIADMDRLPIPDYTEYFSRSHRLSLLPANSEDVADIPFEASRGCWWGEKHHCTFCGLNGANIAYRAKSAARIIAELDQLSRQYRGFRFEAVDNIINFSAFRTFLPELMLAESDYDIFFELKANLSRADIALLRRAGVRRIQPGIESLSSHVLALMRKGCTAAQNVNTLKWARHYGMSVAWNLLWGFPGELPEDYSEQLNLMKSLTHLQPPNGAGRIWMERFSPIFYDRTAFPAQWIRPERSYSYVYPRTVRLDKIAYFFDYELVGTLPESSFQYVTEGVHEWQQAWQATTLPYLSYRRTPGLVRIEDGRGNWPRGTYTFEATLAELYAATSSRPRSLAWLQENIAPEYSAAEVEDAMVRFCGLGLMMRDQNHFLSLAVPAIHSL